MDGCGAQEWIGLVRSLLFDIVDFKEGMRGRRSPECRHRRVLSTRFFAGRVSEVRKHFVRVCVRSFE
jgi:hypothetical protein